MSAPLTPADLVLLHIGPSILAVPRREVRDLLAPQDQHEVPVLVLDDALRVTSVVPAKRRICVLLDGGSLTFGLLCDEFEHRIDVDGGVLAMHALPSAMRAPRSPVKAVLQLGDAVAAVTDAQALAEAFEVRAAATMETA